MVISKGMLLRIIESIIADMLTGAIIRKRPESIPIVAVMFIMFTDVARVIAIVIAFFAARWRNLLSRMQP